MKLGILGAAAAGALLALCACGAAAQSDRGGVEAWNAALDARMAGLGPRLETLQSLDELIVAAELAPFEALRLEFSPDPAQRGERLRVQARVHERLLALHPGEPIALHTVAAFCARTDTAALAPCDGPNDILRTYADAVPDNAWPWLMWAARARASGDLPGAAWALEKAAGATHLTWYGTETLGVYHRFIGNVALPDDGQAPYHVRFTATMGYFLAIAIPSLGDIMDVCPDPERDPSLTEAQRAQCFRVGRLFAAAPTLLDASMGAILLTRHAQNAAERREAEAFEVRKSALSHAAVELLPTDEHPDAEQQRAFEAYARDMLAAGEMHALERLVERSGSTMDEWIAKTRAARETAN